MQLTAYIVMHVVWISAPDSICHVDFEMIHLVLKKSVENVGVLKMRVVILKRMLKNGWKFHTFMKKWRNYWTETIRLLIADNRNNADI